MIHLLLVVLATALGLGVGGCTGDDPAGAGIPEHLLVDVDGRTWDIRYALEELGLDRDGFGHGIGVHAIPPIVDPASAGPGDAGYPGPAEAFPILGVEIAGRARAYRLQTLTRHEVANDTLGGTPLAATY